MKNKAFILTCYFSHVGRDRAKDIMARAVTFADTEELARANVAAQAKKNGYILAKVETITALVSRDGLNIQALLNEARNQVAAIEPFVRINSSAPNQ